MYERRSGTMGGALIAALGLGLVVGCTPGGTNNNTSGNNTSGNNTSGNNTSGNNTSGNSTSHKHISLPLVTPPVKAAAPEGLTGPKSALNLLRSRLRHVRFESTAHADPGSDSPGQGFKDRFFSGSGPTDLLGSLLPYLDRIITGLNSQTSSSPCLTQTPVAYTISPFGQSVSMYAQCYTTNGGMMGGSAMDGGVTDTPDAGVTPGTPFLQFGVDAGVTYIYAGNGVEQAAAIVTPETGGQYRVQAWFSLGSTNGLSGGCGTAWDMCSYGVIELSADQATSQFELAVAGVGFGFCGAQLTSDGTNIYAVGSTDMGNDCDDVANVCLSAADATTVATCTTAEQTFALSPIGRKGSARSAAAASPSAPANNGVAQPNWGGTQYPMTANVTLDGTATDDVQSFGPTSPTAGVGAL